MSAVLVTLAELKAFLQSTGTSDDVVLQSLLDSAEDQFLADCNRRDRPFKAIAEEDRIEACPGTGDVLLALDYPISDIVAITLGRDVSNPVETLDPDDLNVVVWQAGKRTITRVDGGVWGCFDAPAYVHVTYDAQAELPDLPRVAIKRAVAAIYRQVGAEDTTRERLSSYERDLRDVYTGDSIWKAAVNATIGHRS